MINKLYILLKDAFFGFKKQDYSIYIKNTIYCQHGTKEHKLQNDISCLFFLNLKVRGMSRVSLNMMYYSKK